MNNREIIKKRLLFGIAGSLLFVYLGWYLFSISEEQDLISPNIVGIVGVVSMVFFGAAAIIGLKKYFDK